MKVCVFGASGYVGASVYKQLADIPNIDIVGTYLDDPERFEGLEKLDINQPESFSDFFKKENPDVVIWSVMSGPNEYELTDHGFMHLLTHLTPQTKLIYISSDFVFSEGRGPYTEDDPISALPEDHIYSNYTNGKVKAERLINQELTNFTILRAGPIYGDNQIGKSDEYTDQLSAQLQLGKSSAFRDDLIRTFVHVEDLAKVVIELVQNEETGTYHVGPSKQQSFYQFMQLMAERLGYDASLIEKGSEHEEADQEIPKNTSLITDKISKITNQTFR